MWNSVSLAVTLVPLPAAAPPPSPPPPPPEEPPHPASPPPPRPKGTRRPPPRSARRQPRQPPAPHGSGSAPAGAPAQRHDQSGLAARLLLVNTASGSWLRREAAHWRSMQRGGD